MYEYNILFLMVETDIKKKSNLPDPKTGWLFFLKICFIYLEREGESKGRGRGRRREISSSTERECRAPCQGLIPQSWDPDLSQKSKVWHLTNLATQVLQIAFHPPAPHIHFSQSFHTFSGNTFLNLLSCYWVPPKQFWPIFHYSDLVFQH